MQDDAKILSSETKCALSQIRFPEDIPVIVRTVPHIPPREMGTFATDLMSKDAGWQKLRPRSWLRRWFRQDLPSDRGVFVLVSMDPQLLQIRFGRAIRLGAYQQMLAVGTWYRSQQTFERNALDQHVLNTVQELASRMRKLTAPPWPLSWALSLASSVESEVEDFLAPSDGLYSKAVLSRYIWLAHGLGA